MNIKYKLRFINFDESISGIPLPKKFTFPFYYKPHPLSVLAAEQLQTYLSTQKEWTHNFGINNPNDLAAIGKMFGVLVVENKSGEIGFISAFSGKMLGEKTPDIFVPNLFDANPDVAFYINGSKELNIMTQEIERLENSSDLLELQKVVEKEKNIFTKKIEALKSDQRSAKFARKEKRNTAKSHLSSTEYNILLDKLGKESIAIRNKTRDMEFQLQSDLDKITAPLVKLEEEIAELRTTRKEKSVNLQQALFAHYRFLNILGEEKNLLEIFKDVPKPSGAGECAAPKLLQYACLLYTSDAADE